MRIVLFSGEGRAATLAVQSLQREHTVTDWFIPSRGWRSQMKALIYRRPQPIGRRQLQRLEIEADLICIAGFPWVLPDSVLRMASLGAINAHPSLLPRHRGPLPLFWIYYSGDLETGVSIHRATGRPDAGPILSQRSFVLPRGMPVRDVAFRKQDLAAEMLAHAASEIARGTHHELEQQESLATAAPFVRSGTAMVDFNSWNVDRVWHFLHGLWPFFKEPVTMAWRGVGPFREESHSESPGTVRPTREGALLYCRGGTIRLH